MAKTKSLPKASNLKEMESQIQERIAKTLPARLETYGFTVKDFPKLPSLVVSEPMTLSPIDKQCAGIETVREIRVKDFAHLKQIFGTPKETCSHIIKTSNLAVNSEKYISDLTKDELANEVNYNSKRLRKLAEHYLYYDAGIMDKNILKRLKDWRFPGKMVIWLWNSIIVRSGCTLTLSNHVHILWVNRIILEAGARLVAAGNIRIHAHRLESY